MASQIQPVKKTAGHGLSKSGPQMMPHHIFGNRRSQKTLLDPINPIILKKISEKPDDSEGERVGTSLGLRFPKRATVEQFQTPQTFADILAKPKQLTKAGIDKFIERQAKLAQKPELPPHIRTDMHTIAADPTFSTPKGLPSHLKSKDSSRVDFFVKVKRREVTQRDASIGSSRGKRAGNNALEIHKRVSQVPPPMHNRKDTWTNRDSTSDNTIPEKALISTPDVTKKVSTSTISIKREGEKPKSKGLFTSVSIQSKPGRHSDALKSNQDAYFIEPKLFGLDDCAMLAVFDGHGKEGSKHLVKHLTALKEQKALNDADRIKSEIVHSFQATDNELNQSDIDTESSGSTCVCTIIIKQKLYLANLGDSAAGMVCRGDGLWELKRLSRDHHPTQEEEANRVLRCGGRIDSIKSRSKDYLDSQGEPIGPLRVWKKYENTPGLMMTRSFGDRIGHTIGLISIPEIKEFQIRDSDIGLILGSDGLWEHLPYPEAAKAIKASLSQFNIMKGCLALLDLAEQGWIRETQEHPNSEQGVYIDDITCLIAIFAPPGKRPLSRHNFNEKKLSQP